MSWTAPTFDKFQFGGKRTQAVSARYTPSGWESTGITFSDFDKMHTQRREKVQERRLPTPKWSVNDDWLRELLVVYLEQRFYVHADTAGSLADRLRIARAAAERYAPYKRELLKDWLEDYYVLSTKGRADLSDDDAIATFISLRHIGGQLPINADVARDYIANKKLHDLDIQIQNIDTDLVLTEKGHAEIIAAIVYLYYRLGWDSVTVAEQLGLKPPHVRQVLARLHATWKTSLSHLFEKKQGGKDPSGNPPSGRVSGSTPPAPIEELPLMAIFEGGV